MVNRLIWLSLSVLLLPIWVCASTVHEYTLDNGLKLIVKEDHRAPVAVSQIWYKVGSSYEPIGISGISHALEHMMFKGTKTVPLGGFSRRIAEQGGEENAMTSRDFTVYFQTIAAKNLPLSFELESDRMQNLQFVEKEYENEINVVREERRLRTDDNPQNLTLERFYAAVFLATPYHHPVIGWMDDLLKMKMTDLQQWYQQWYAPNNATVVVVGDVQPDAVYALAKKYFGHIPRREVPTEKIERPLPQTAEKRIEVKVPAKLPWLLFGFLVPSVNTAEVKWEPYALDLAAAILSEGESSRLQSELVRGKAIATEASGDYSPFERLDSTFVIAGTPSQGHDIKLLGSAFKEELQRLRDKPVSKSELNRIRTQVIAEKIYSKDSMSYQAFEIGNFVTIGVPWQMTEEYLENIKQVTPAQIQAVAQKYLTPERLTIAELMPLPWEKAGKNHKQGAITHE